MEIFPWFVVYALVTLMNFMGYRLFGRFGPIIVWAVGFSALYITGSVTEYPHLDVLLLALGVAFFYLSLYTYRFLSKRLATVRG